MLLVISKCASHKNLFLPKKIPPVQGNIIYPRKYRLMQGIFVHAENISCYRKYFLSQKTFPIPDNIICPYIFSLLRQEMVPATGNISCHRKYFLF